MKATKTLFLISLALAVFTASVWAENRHQAHRPRDHSSPAPPPITAADVQALKMPWPHSSNRSSDSHCSCRASGRAVTAIGAGSCRQDQRNPNSTATVSGISSPAVQQNTAPSSGLKSARNDAGESREPAGEPRHLHSFQRNHNYPRRIRRSCIRARSRALGADLTTPFNSLTMPGASQSRLSEFFGSAPPVSAFCGTSTGVWEM